MEHYNRLVADHLLDNVDRMIDRVPQPQMLGGKRERQYVLPGQTSYDYAERSLGVQGHPDDTLWDDEGGNDEELGGKRPSKFWRDFGRGFETGFSKTLEMGLPLVMAAAGRKKGMHQTYNGGAVFEDGSSTPRITPRNKRGGKVNIGKVFKQIGKEVKPLAERAYKEILLPEAKKRANKYFDKNISAPAPVSAPAPEMAVASASGRRRGGKVNVGKVFKQIGKTLAPVGKALKPVAEKAFREILLPEAKKRANAYFDSRMASSAPVEMAVESAAGRGRRRHRKIPHYDSESDSDEESEYGEGGALLMDHPGEFHSHHYPKGLASYKAKKGGKRAPSARGAIVSRVMKEKGLSLPEASKYVKEHGLY